MMLLFILLSTRFLTLGTAQTPPPQQSNCFTRFNGQNLRWDECALEGLGFESELYYNLDPELVEILYRVPRIEGWISFGFSDARLMNPADCIIGWQSSTAPENNRLGDFFMRGKTFDSIVEANNQDVLDMAIEQSDDFLALYFLRPRVVNGTTTIELNGTTPIIYGWGPLPGCEVCPIPYHGRELRGVLDFNFIQGDFGGIVVDLWVILHSFLVAGAWGILAPIGITIARFGRNTCKGTWFYLHRSTMLIAVAAGIAGTVIGIYEIGTGTELIHFILGVVITGLGFFQPVMHIFKPKGGKGEKTKLRVAWEIVHKLVGYSVAVLAPINIWFGMELIEFDEFWFLLFWCSFSAIAAVYVILSIRDIWSDNFDRRSKFRAKLSSIWSSTTTKKSMNAASDTYDDFLCAGDTFVPKKNGVHAHADAAGDIPEAYEGLGENTEGTPDGAYAIVYRGMFGGSTRELRNPVESISEESKRKRWKSI